MKYDDYSWHSEGDFPEDLPEEAGATHIGIFFTWAVLAGLASDDHLEDSKDELPLLQNRRMTPREYLLVTCDGRLTDEDLSPLGNSFANHYVPVRDDPYSSDYEEVLVGELPTSYHVADTWENFDLICPVINERYASWKKNQAN